MSDIKIISYNDNYKEQTIKLIFDILENEFGRKSKSGRPDVKNIPEFYQKDELSDFWIAIRDNDELIGTIALSNFGEGISYLQRFFVKKEFRREGLGRKLLNHLLDFARAHGYKEIYLSTSEDMVSANKFYLKNGFERIESLPEKLVEQSAWDNVFYKLDLTK